MKKKNVIPTFNTSIDSVSTSNLFLSQSIIYASTGAIDHYWVLIHIFVIYTFFLYLISKKAQYNHIAATVDYKYQPPLGLFQVATFISRVQLPTCDTWNKLRFCVTLFFFFFFFKTTSLWNIFQLFIRWLSIF